MAGKREQTLCIDIGGDSIKVAEFSYTAEGAVVLEKFSFRELKTPTPKAEADENAPDDQDMLFETVKNILSEDEYRAREVNVSISAQNAFVRFVKVPAMTKDPAQIAKLLEFEAKQNIPFPEDEVVYGSQIIPPVEGDEESSAEVEAMFVILKNAEAEGIYNRFDSIRKNVGILEIAPAACYNAAHFNGIGEENCEMILNIGGRCSTLMFIDNDRFFIRTFLTAGHSITQQIAKEFNISFADAEEMKRKHGFVGLGGAYEEPESEVAATVSKIIRNVMTRLHGEINRTINVYRSQQHGRKPTKLYLCGGSSVMMYSTHFFAEKLRIPVEYFNPFEAVSVSPRINKEELALVAHIFPDVVGLAMRSAFPCPIQISLTPESRKKKEEMRKKIPYFYASCVALLFCMGVIYWSFDKRGETYVELKSKAETIKKTTLDLTKQVNDNYTYLGGINKEYDTAVELLKGRGIWTDVMNKIQSATPDLVWYTEIKATDKPALTKATGPAAAESEEKSPFAGFSTRSSHASEPEVVSTGDLAWIILKGNILCNSSDAPKIYENLKSQIEATGLFAQFTQEDTDTMARYFMNAPYGANVSTFTIQAKLKQPIKQ